MILCRTNESVGERARRREGSLLKNVIARMGKYKRISLHQPPPPPPHQPNNNSPTTFQRLHHFVCLEFFSSFRSLKRGETNDLFSLEDAKKFCCFRASSSTSRRSLPTLEALFARIKAQGIHRQSQVAKSLSLFAYQYVLLRSKSVHSSETIFFHSASVAFSLLCNEYWIA